MVSLKRKGNYLGIRVSDEELKVIERIKDSRGFETISDAIRDLIRFADVFFDDRLTMKKALKPHILKLVKSEKNLEIIPVCDSIKSVPEMEKILKSNPVLG